MDLILFPSTAVTFLEVEEAVNHLLWAEAPGCQGKPRGSMPPF